MISASSIWARTCLPSASRKRLRGKMRPVVGLSALMTTTLPAMEETIRLLKTRLPQVKIVAGGAVLTAAYARSIGADLYAADAMATVRFCESVVRAKQEEK